MARKPAAQTPVKVRRRRRRPKPVEISGFGPLIVFGLVTLAFFNLNVAGLVLVGLSPTIVLGFTGKGEHKNYKLQCVGFLNLAGILPFAAKVWAHPNQFATVIVDPLALVMMFGAAGIGYALIYVGPMVAAIILQSLSEERIKTINQQRASLVEAWGPDVIMESGAEDPAWAAGRRTPPGA